MLKQKFNKATIHSFDDAGDGTCTGCGREKDECYCDVVEDKDD